MITAARHEGTIRVREGRQLGIAEFGPPDGRAVVWFHGTPGARRQIPEEARLIAGAEGIRIIGIDRPGVGLSTPHLYDAIVDLAADVEIVADRLGHRALQRDRPVGRRALRAGHGLGAGRPGPVGRHPRRRGADPWARTASAAAWSAWPRRFAAVLPLVREPLGVAAHGVRPGDQAARQADAPAVRPRSRREGDRAVLERPEFQAMFLDDLSTNGGRSMRAVVYDAILFTRDWGFSPRDVQQPVAWWHGDADHIVPFAHAQHLVPLHPERHAPRPPRREPPRRARRRARGARRPYCRPGDPHRSLRPHRPRQHPGDLRRRRPRRHAPGAGRRGARRCCSSHGVNHLDTAAMYGAVRGCASARGWPSTAAASSSPPRPASAPAPAPGPSSSARWSACRSTRSTSSSCTTSSSPTSGRSPTAPAARWRRSCRRRTRASSATSASPATAPASPACTCAASSASRRSRRCSCRSATSALQDPAYRADVEALLEVCADEGVAVQTIKGTARRRWREDDDGPPLQLVRAAHRRRRHRPGRALGAGPPAGLPQHTSDARVLPTVLAAAIGRAATARRRRDGGRRRGPRHRARCSTAASSSASEEGHDRLRARRDAVTDPRLRGLQGVADRVAATADVPGRAGRRAPRGPSEPAIACSSSPTPMRPGWYDSPEYRARARRRGHRPHPGRGRRVTTATSSGRRRPTSGSARRSAATWPGSRPDRPSFEGYHDLWQWSVDDLPASGVGVGVAGARRAVTECSTVHARGACGSRT